MKDRGFTLVEVLIALVVLAIGTVAAYRSIGMSATQIGDAPRRLLTQEAALNRVSELQVMGAGARLPDTTMQGPYRIAIELARAPTAAGLLEAVVTARTDGIGSQATAYLFPGAAR